MRFPSVQTDHLSLFEMLASSQNSVRRTARNILPMMLLRTRGLREDHNRELPRRADYASQQEWLRAVLQDALDAMTYFEEHEEDLL